MESEGHVERVVTVQVVPGEIVESTVRLPSLEEHRSAIVEGRGGGFTNGIQTELVWVSPGTFWMGSPDSEPGRRRDESPRRLVDLPRGFWMGRHELTRQEYREVMGGGPSQLRTSDRHPVVRVTWQEAVEFCARLTTRERDAGLLPEGWSYRLPTESEWEYACRAGTTTRWSFGNDASQLGEFGWYDGNAAGRTHEVGRKDPNAWGLHDMHGNVAEWCADGVHGSYQGAPRDGTAWTEAGDPGKRVHRGGHWNSPRRHCRSAARDGADVHSRWSSLGLRLVLGPGAR